MICSVLAIETADHWDRSQPKPSSSFITTTTMNSLWKLGGSVLVASALLTTTWAAAPGNAVSGNVSIGDEVSYTFRDAPLNSMGVSSTGDLSGKPVLVEFWGTR
ncbi:MAG: hypothetical protein ACI9F9_002248 [Candidatus Paceibacteria bacterium]